MGSLNRLIIVLFFAGLAACKNTPNSDYPNTPQAAANSDFRVEILHPDGEKIISSEAQIEVIAEGHDWTEGPLFVPAGNFLLYSDIPRNSIYRWKEGEGSSLYLKPSGSTGLIEREGQPGSNGLLLNAEGRLVLCQHGDRRVALGGMPNEDIKADYHTLADKFQGAQLNSPNDGDFHSNGDLYFTDPPYGLDQNMEDEAKELDFQGVYRLKPTREVDLVSDALKYPNGIALSHDEKKLYVANSGVEKLYWMVFELDENGLAKSNKIFYDVSEYKGQNKGAPDGLKVNRNGVIFATGPEGVWIFNEEAEVLARIYTGQKTSNCALSADEKQLFMTADDFVLRIPLL